MSRSIGALAGVVVAAGVFGYLSSGRPPQAPPPDSSSIVSSGSVVSVPGAVQSGPLVKITIPLGGATHRLTVDGGIAQTVYPPRGFPPP